MVSGNGKKFEFYTILLFLPNKLRPPRILKINQIIKRTIATTNNTYAIAPSGNTPQTLRIQKIKAKIANKIAKSNNTNILYFIFLFI